MSERTEPPVGRIGVVAATALSVTVVVGAGLLALPGLTHALAGRHGYLPWVAVALLMLPLLAIFAWFGKNHPSAGGVVGYVRASLGQSWAAVAEMIVLGTFTLGIPAIALIGAAYLQQLWPALAPWQVGVGLMTLAYGAGLLGIRISGGIQTGMAALIVIGLLMIGIGYLASHPALDLPPTPPDFPDMPGLAAAVPVVLFAFTGWEMTAFLAEDMKNPRRTLPISIWASFVIVTALYIFIAWVVAVAAVPGSLWRDAPFVALAQGWLGDGGARMVALIATVLVIANVIAAFFSASRAVFSAGRDGLLLRVLGTLDPRGRPFVAMTATYLVFVGIVLATEVTSLSVNTLLQLAGQNFFVLYLFAALGYCRIAERARSRWLGYTAVAAVVGMLPLFSLTGLAYCALLAAIGLWVAGRRADARPARGATSPLTPDSAVLRPTPPAAPAAPAERPPIARG